MKYCDEMTRQITQHLRHGASRDDVMLVCGISKDTFYEWMKKPDFSDQVKKAEGRCKVRNIKIIQRAARKTWQAAAWWLERKFKDEFASRVREWEDAPKTPELSQKAVDTAMAALKLMEEATKNGDKNGSRERHPHLVANGKVGPKASPPPAESV